MGYAELARELHRLVKDVWGEINKWHNSKKMQVNGLAKPKEGYMEYLEEM